MEIFDGSDESLHVVVESSSGVDHVNFFGEEVFDRPFDFKSLLFRSKRY